MVGGRDEAWAVATVHARVRWICKGGGRLQSSLSGQIRGGGNLLTIKHLVSHVLFHLPHKVTKKFLPHQIFPQKFSKKIARQWEYRA